jgi:hypothetical protein
MLFNVIKCQVNHMLGLELCEIFKSCTQFEVRFILAEGEGNIDHKAANCGGRGDEEQRARERGEDLIEIQRGERWSED